MNNKEVRYAIIIGINDYENNELNYCVNDALEFKNILISNCKFNEENIFTITSDIENSNKDITGKYLESIREIKEKFRKEEDSILFYFAGHGSCKNNKSVVWLQNSSYPIENIFSDICSLQPKVQTYIIDACQSGSKVLTRNKEEELQNYIKNSKGTMFLYACQNTESAQELGRLEHGLLTYKILEAINNKKLYDEEGYLTFNRIVDYVQKETSIESSFKQIPVIENNIVGFYPFAIDKELLESSRKEKDIDINIDNHINNNDDEVDSLLSIREKLMSIGVEKLNSELEKLKFDNYEINCIKSFDEMNEYEGVEDLIEEIVNYVEDEKLIPLNNLIYRETEEKNYNTTFGNVLKQMDMLNNVPSVTTTYHISFFSEKLKSNFKTFLSKDINAASFGIGYIYYQAKWGVVALKIAFLIDWDGERCSLIDDVNIEYIALPLENESISTIDDIEIGFDCFSEKLIEEWNHDRKEELNRFRKFTIKKVKALASSKNFDENKVKK